MQISHFSRVYANGIPSINALNLIYPREAGVRFAKLPDDQGMSTQLRAAQLSLFFVLREESLRIFADTMDRKKTREEMSV